MAFATEVYELPTRGLLEGIPKTVTIRNMTTAEEKMLLGSSDDAFESIISKCVEDEGFDILDCTSADKFFLLIRLRTISYGNDYYYRYTCPHCGKTHEYMVDLDKLEVEYLPEDFKEPYDTFTLPLTKDKIALKIPRNRDLQDIKNKVKRYNKRFPEAKGDVTLIYTMIANIQSVNDKVPAGSEFLTYIEGLPVKDSSFIRNRIQKLRIGIDTTIFEECKNPACKEELEIPLRLGPEFFHTRDGE